MKSQSKPRKKHIAIDARMLGWPGIGRYTRELVMQLQKLDQTTTYSIILLESDVDKIEITAPNFNKLTVGAKPYSLGEQIRLARLLYKIRPDLVHFLAPNQPLLYLRQRISTISDLTLVKFFNVRKHKALYLPRYAIFRILVWWVVHRSAHIITISRTVRTELMQRYRIDGSRITPILLAQPDFQEASKPYINPRLGKNFLLYVGYAYPHKNLSRLIQAMVELRNQQPTIQLVLVGKRNYFYEQLEQQAQKLGLRDCVIFTGFVGDEQLSWLYKHAKVFVFPSLSEGFGLPLLEAFHYNLPVAASSASCIPEIAGKGAHYFDPHDVNNIVKVVSEVIENAKLQTKLKNNGRVQLAKFSWARMAEQTLKLYKQQLNHL